MRRTVIAAGIIASVAVMACGTKDTPVPDSTAMTPVAEGAMSAGSNTPDGEMQAVLDELAALNGKPVETLDAAEARKQPTPTDAVKKLLTKQGKPETPPPGTTMTTKMVAGAAGQLPANIYTPDGAGPFPVIVYYHGGGFVIASKEVYDGGARGLSIAAKAVVISADYRLAPEHKFPAAHDDAIAIYEWALKNAASIKGDPTKIALAGESAGGNLAVATAIAARDKKLQAPLAIIAVYPIAQSDTTTPSYVEHANAKPLSRTMMNWFFKNYGRTPADGKDPRVSLVDADLKGLPPVTIITAQIDPLRSDSDMLGEKLRAAGVTVDHKNYESVTHEFFGMAAVNAKAKEAQAYAAAALTKVFQ